MSGEILVERRGPVQLVTIDRPTVRNAVDRAGARAIAAALDELDASTELAAGVIFGAGGGFSAGMDLKALVATGEGPFDQERGAFGLCGRPPEKPLVAAVEGVAYGGGFEIALACDLVVASEDARFALPEVKRGLVAGGGGVLRLPRRLPRNVAMEMALGGEPIGAERAHQLGLVNRVVPSGACLEAALELAAGIAANAPLATRTSKRLIADSALWPEAEMFDRQEPLVDAVRSSEDAAEGTRAFVEKREPRWSGR